MNSRKGLYCFATGGLVALNVQTHPFRGRSNEYAITVSSISTVSNASYVHTEAETYLEKVGYLDNYYCDRTCFT